MLWTRDNMAAFVHTTKDHPICSPANRTVEFAEDKGVNSPYSFFGA